MELTRKQAEAIQSKARYKVLNWGRRSGKTTEFAYEALGTALTVDNAKVSYYAQTFGDAREIAWNIFLGVFGGSVIKKNETLLEITVKNLKGGTSKIGLKGWESVVTANKGRGTENDLLLLDEVAFCRGFNEYWDTVLDPTILTSRGRVVFGSTPDGFNHFYDLTEKAMRNESGEWFYSHATSFDNPANDPTWLENKKKEITEDKFSQEYLADFRKQEGLVYKEFNRERHIFSELPQRQYIDTFAGVDFGYTNPACILAIKKDYDGNYWVVSEWYKSGKTNQEIIEYAKTIGAQSFYPDPAEPDRIEEMSRAGLYVKEVNKDVEKGIDSVRNLFKNNKLFIHKDCKHLIWELETYAYKAKGADRNTPEEPIKENDHALDALRYALFMATGVVSMVRPLSSFGAKPSFR